MPYQTTLDGTALPTQFSYKPATPIKRTNVKQTVNAVVIQTASEIVPGDSIIAWECPHCCFDEWQFFLGKANQNTNPTMPFVGYWGDSFTVKFHVFDKPETEGKLFSLSGSFQIVELVSWSA